MKKVNFKLFTILIAITTILGCASSENTPSNTAPTVTTTTISNVTLNSASTGGNVTSDGGEAVTTRGIVWNTATSPTISLTTKTNDGSGTGNFSSSITGLIPSNTYFVRAYATNSIGTAYGNELSFTTGAIVLPTVTTTAITGITTNAAVSGGSITTDGGGAITARGVVWSASQNPTIALTTKTTNGTGLGSFASNMTTLAQNTTYYVKAYATNIAGTAYGNQVEFKTNATIVTVTDVDGNVYNTVKICDQTWTKSNLNVSHYRNGDVIPQVTDPSQWENLTTGAWCYYNNDPANGAVYGKLYNWYAVNDSRGLAPQGYHIPTDNEWNSLIICLDPSYLPYTSRIAGGKMKEIGTTHWKSPNTGANNNSGFTALPAGFRFVKNNDDFQDMGYESTWWSSSEYNPDALGVDVYSISSDARNSVYFKQFGNSVRCIKD